MSKISLAVIIPVYNDWGSLALLIPRLDELLADNDVDTDLIIVNDASSQDTFEYKSLMQNLKAIGQIDMVDLNCNLGHQRAIAIGLVEAAKKSVYDAVIVMDADGEDRPEDVIKILNLYRSLPEKKIIVAKRNKRSEGLPFKIGYFIYRFIFRLLTGQSMYFGNFCLLPAEYLGRLIYRDSLWNHLSATILRSRLPIIMIPADRGRRLQGKAKMNFGELILLGLSAISVYIDKVFLRTLLFSAFLCISAVTGMAVVTILRFFTDLAIPGWASSVVGSLLVILVLSFLLSIFVLFIVLANRSQILMLPAKSASDYIKRTETIFNK